MRERESAIKNFVRFLSGVMPKELLHPFLYEPKKEPNPSVKNRQMRHKRSP